MSPRDVGPIYVAYLPVPRGLVGWLRVIVPTLLWGACALGALIGGTMSSSGPGSWNSTDTRAFEGTMCLNPYPCVFVPDPASAGGVRAILIVESGKFGARRVVSGLEGATVRVEGFVLEREGRLMLELLPGEGGLSPVETPVPGTAPTFESLGPIVLRGEIVDSKCWYGAMKPGAGIRHRACARLCVKGGIPPAIVVPTAQGDRCYLIETESGQPANELVLDRLGIPIEVRGALYERGGLYTVRLAREGIRPITHL